MRLDFEKSVEFEGKTYEGLDLNLEALIGKDIIATKKEAMDLARMPVTDVSKIYHVCVAARASGVTPDMILSLPAKEFNRVTLETQGFLLAL